MQELWLHRASHSNRTLSCDPAVNNGHPYPVVPMFRKKTIPPTPMLAFPSLFVIISAFKQHVDHG